MMPMNMLFPFPEPTRYEEAFDFPKPTQEFTVVLSTPSSKYEHEFKPIRDVGSQLTERQFDKAIGHNVTHVCIFAGKEPKWLCQAAEKQGYKAYCLGYTRHKRHGFVTKEVWGLTPTEDQVIR